MRDLPKIALVGCGYWGKNLCRNFNAIGVLSQVVDATEAGQANARAIAPGVAVSSSFDEVLEDPSIKALALATPAETHADLAVRAMEAGKDVFVEKPMALTLEDAEKMKAVADGNDRVLMVGHLLEYHPAVLKLRQLIDSGELGKINYVYSNRLNFGKVRTEENALWSFAPHDISMILSLIKENVKSVRTEAATILRPNIADTATIHLQFESGIKAHVSVSWIHPYKEQKLVTWLI